MNRFCIHLLAVLLMGMAFIGAKAQDLMSDTWVGTDALGRHMPTSKEVGPLKKDKARTVGIFYVTWHTQDLHNRSGIADVSKVLQADPEARINGNSSAWPEGMGSWHWGEPEYGYFLSRDKYVIRHDMSMLTDAGVDVIIFDVTNAVCYYDEWDTILETMEQMKKEGNTVPKICFWTYNGPAITTTQHVYEKYYKQGKYRDLWFYWEGKPLLLCNMRPELDANGGGVTNPNPNFDADAVTNTSNPHYGNPDYTEKNYKFYPREVQDFFTMRNMWWGYYEWGGKRYVGTEDNWTFGLQMNDKNVADLSPKQLASTHKGRLEECCVTPAQHPISITGKSWRRQTAEPKLNQYDEPDSAFVPWLGKTVKNPSGYGIYFQDRWDEALQADPDFLYLNDWNEWTAGKYPIGKAPGSEENGPQEFLGRKNNTFFFVDQYNAEFNRTIEPVRGQYTDNYYMQMAENIRRYKGARPIPVNHGFTPIRLDGNFNDWQGVATKYLDTRYDTFHRDHDGYSGLHFVNNSGRNDIVESKVAFSATNVFFYVQTSAALTPSTDHNWMLLLIDADCNSKTGWYGYDFIVNYNVKNSSQTMLMRYSSKEKQWKSVAVIPYSMKGNEMEIAVPRKLLGLMGNKATFDFKWADNPQNLKDPISLCTDGDTAPNRRFNYRCIWAR